MALPSLDVGGVVEVGEEEEVGEGEDDEAVAEELGVVWALKDERADGVRDDENKLRLQTIRVQSLAQSHKRAEKPATPCADEPGANKY